MAPDSWTITKNTYNSETLGYKNKIIAPSDFNACFRCP